MPHSSSPDRRLARVAAVVLVVATATCVDRPTEPRDEPVTPPPAVHSHAVTASAVATGITHTLLTAGVSKANQSTCTTASITPAANALVLVAVLGHNTNTAAPSPTVSGGGMKTWTQVQTLAFDNVPTPHKRLSVFRAMSAAPGSGQIKITFTTTQANCEWVVAQWQGVVTSGTNGGGAVAQPRTARGDNVTGRVVTLNAFAATYNVAYGVFGVSRSTTGITPGAGFTETTEQPSGETPAADLMAEWSVGDNTIDAAWPKANGGGIGLEIKAAGPPPGPPPNPVASVVVTPDSTGVLVADTVRLAAATMDAGGEPLTGRTITWSTSASQVATVSSTGLVTAVALGTATITAMSEGKTGTAKVTVTNTQTPVASVEVQPAAPTVAAGSTVQLTATPKDASGQPLTGRTVTWSSGSPQVATVSIAGLVTAVTPGLAVITATSGGQPGTSSVTVTALSKSAIEGEWSGLKTSPYIQVHSNLMPSGRVLVWGKSDPQLWDPATGGFTPVPSTSLIFCAGQAFLPDGRLFVVGGHVADNVGLPAANIFDPATNTWQQSPAMAQGRWYPTAITLPSGEVLVLSGTSDTGVVVTVPEIWSGSSWRQLTTASRLLPNYPRTFVAPDGRVFVAGQQPQSWWLDVAGTGRWSTGPVMNFGTRQYGAAVMYAPGKILYAGGGNPPTNTAEIIDLNATSPQWSYTNPMAYVRWNLNATLLPTGDVLVTGGTNKADRTDPTGAVRVAELWNPGTGQWTQLASAGTPLRGYHSTSVLLPDGRVLHSGGGDGANVPENFNYEVYSPPYLFKGTRPVISGEVPSSAGYGQTLTLTTADASTIAKVTLIRLGSTTHAFDQAQHIVQLGFSQATGGLSVNLPSSRIAAPPGPYMVFIVNGNGVPSVGKILRLQ